MYARLIDGDLVVAPKKLIINDTQVWNAPAEEYLAQGWLPVILTEPPEAPEGYYYESGWTEENDTIIETWTLTELPEPSADELMSIILGETE